jgi:hypothetical protein
MHRLRFALVMLIGCVSPLWAAEKLTASEAKEVEAMLAKEAAVQAAQAKTATASTKTAQPAAAGKSATQTAAPAQNNQDFVPTTKISEDLPVSFPADI